VARHHRRHALRKFQLPIAGKRKGTAKPVAARRSGITLVGFVKLDKGYFTVDCCRNRLAAKFDELPFLAGDAAGFRGSRFFGVAGAEQDNRADEGGEQKGFHSLVFLCSTKLLKFFASQYMIAVSHWRP